MTDTELLDEIEAIRAKNNSLHVGIQRLALLHSPDSTRRLLAEIIKNDERITAISKQLATDPSER